MDYFQLLLLAHIIGDFPLQTDAIYRLKQKTYWGVVLHVIVCTIINIIILFQFLNSVAIWGVIGFLAIFHFTLDRTKILLAVFKAKDGLRYFFIDQLFHLISLYISAVWLTLMYKTPVPQIHVKMEFIIALNALLMAAFVVPAILYYTHKKIKIWYHLQEPFAFPTAKERLPGSLARLLATGGLILGRWYALLLLLAAIIPFLAPQNRSRASIFRTSEAIINIIACIVSALYYHLF